MSIERKHLDPVEGGCWFCHKDQCDAFSTEFDTYLHMDCLKYQLHANTVAALTDDYERDPEVDIIAEEFGLLD